MQKTHLIVVIIIVHAFDYAVQTSIRAVQRCSELNYIHCLRLASLGLPWHPSAVNGVQRRWEGPDSHFPPVSHSRPHTHTCHSCAEGLPCGAFGSCGRVRDIIETTAE